MRDPYWMEPCALLMLLYPLEDFETADDGQF